MPLQDPADSGDSDQKLGIPPTTSHARAHALHNNNNNWPDDKVRRIHIWLHTVGINLPDQRTLVDAYCVMLREVAGLPVNRFFTSVAVLHPLVEHKVCKWINGHTTEQSYTRMELKQLVDKNYFGTAISGESNPKMCTLVVLSCQHCSYAWLITN